MIEYVVRLRQKNFRRCFEVSLMRRVAATGIAVLFIFGVLMTPILCVAAVMMAFAYIRWCMARGILWYQMRDMPKLNKDEQDEALRLADKMDSGRAWTPAEDRWVESRFGGVRQTVAEPKLEKKRSGPGSRYASGPGPSSSRYS